MKPVLHILLSHCVLLYASGLAQPAADSLKLLVANAQNDSVKTMHLVKLTRHYYSNGLTDSALKYGKLGVESSRSANSPSIESTAYSALGLSYYYGGDYKNALDNYLHCLKIEEKLGRKPRIARMYNNIGTLYMDQKLFDQAEAQFMKSYSIWTALNDTAGLIQVTNNLGVMFGTKSQFTDDTVTAAGYVDKALTYNTKTYELAGRIKDSIMLLHALSNLGQNYMYLDNYKAALNNFRLALAMEKRLNRQRETGISLLHLADVFSRMREHARAIAHLEEALEIGERINNSEIRKFAYMNLAENYGATGNFRKAYEAHKMFTAISDSLMNSESTRQLHELQVSFDTEKKEKENAMLQEKNKNAAKTIRQQRVIGVAIAIICVLLICFAVLIFRANREKHRINLQLEKKNALIESQKALVEEKQKEIIDSIHYARRIQRSLLPSEKYIERTLDRLRQLQPRGLR